MRTLGVHQIVISDVCLRPALKPKILHKLHFPATTWTFLSQWVWKVLLFVQLLQFHSWQANHTYIRGYSSEWEDLFPQAENGWEKISSTEWWSYHWTLADCKVSIDNWVGDSVALCSNQWKEKGLWDGICLRYFDVYVRRNCPLKGFISFHWPKANSLHLEVYITNICILSTEHDSSFSDYKILREDFNPPWTTCTDSSFK